MLTNQYILIKKLLLHLMIKVGSQKNGMVIEILLLTGIMMEASLERIKRLLFEILNFFVSLIYHGHS